MASVWGLAATHGVSGRSVGPRGRGAERSRLAELGLEKVLGGPVRRALRGELRHAGPRVKRSDVPRQDSSEELTIETATLTLAARAWGPVEGPPVLGLHGWLDNANTFEGLAPLLPTLRFVALDLPGHGKSGHHAPGHLYPFVDFVAEVFHAVEALGWSRFSIVGHSLGGNVAAMLAGAVPHRLEKLVLLEGLGPLPESAEQAPDRLARALAAESKREASPRDLPVYPSRDEVAKRLRAANSSLSDAAIACLLRRGLQERADGQVTWRTDRRLRAISRLRFTEDQVLAFLRRITCPTLLVRATNGFPLANEWGRRRCDAIENLTIEDVEGGHHVHLDEPTVVAPLLQRFLADLGRPS